MRIKHIYITKEGEPMANPEMDLPKPLDFYDFEVDDGDFQKADEDYNEALEKYHSGLLPFEDSGRSIDFPIEAWTGLPPRLKPDTLIPVDIEVEVVEQVYGHGKWNDRMFTGEFYKLPSRKYRKVLRIKP